MTLGILDSLLGLHTNKAANAATTAANAATTATHNSSEQAMRGLTQDAEDAVTGYGNQAIGAVNTGVANALGDLTSQGALAQRDVANGVNSAVGTVQGSNAAYQPYQQNGQSALAMLANSYGLNGSNGNAAATSAFQAGPGYQWQQDQATDAAARKMAALGMAGSGNTIDAITRLSSNLANQEYGQWQSGLSGLANTGMQANNAVTANNATAAGYQYGGGLAGGSLAQQLGQSQAAVNQTQGQQLGSLYSNQGTQMSALNTNLANGVVANNTWATGANNNASLNNAVRQDNVSTANNGIFSSLLGGGLNALGQTATGKAFTAGLMKL